METNLSDNLVVPHVPDILLLRPQDKIRDQGFENAMGNRYQIISK